MNLHRVDGEPEWADVPADRRNVWQRSAAATHGWLTVGNLFSLIGLLSVPLGLVMILGHDAYAGGAAVLLLGRLCDLLDGWLADATGTKSPLGEKIDATFDKVSTGVTIIVLTIAGKFPWWLFVALALPHVITSVLALILYFDGKGIHPSRSGKFSMAAAWLCMLAFIVLLQFGDSNSNFSMQLLILTAAGLLLILSVVLGTIATIGYIREFRRLRQPANPAK